MKLVRDWNEFWFVEKSPAPLGLFRIVFGVAFICWGLLMAPPNLYTWYSEQGMVPLAFYHEYNHYAQEPCLLSSMTDAHLLFAFWCFYLVVAFFFTIGLCSRISALLLFILFQAFNLRDPLILNSGDTMMRCVLFLLLFAPIGASCSVDRMIAIARGIDPGGEPARMELWAQRLIQVQISVVYASTLASKISGQDWLNGTAVYFPLHMDEMTRYPLPAFVSQPWIINILTWGTLFTECSMAFLVWSRKARPYCLCLGVLLHSGIEYALNIPLFSMVMISSYVNFLYNEWIAAFVNALSASFRTYRLRVQLPANVSIRDRWCLVVERLDALHLVEMAVDPQDTDATLRVCGRGWEASGTLALRRIIFAFPALWLLVPLFFLPGATRLLGSLLPRPVHLTPQPEVQPTAAV